MNTDHAKCDVMTLKRKREIKLMMSDDEEINSITNPYPNFRRRRGQHRLNSDFIYSLPTNLAML